MKTPIVFTLSALALLPLLSGCQGFGQWYERALTDIAAREGRGEAFQANVTAEGRFEGYSQFVNGDEYMYSANGHLLGVHRKGDFDWIEHRDSSGRLIEKTLNSEGTSLWGRRVYHYSPEGELLGSTYYSVIDGKEFLSHTGPDGYRLRDQENLPWER